MINSRFTYLLLDFITILFPLIFSFNRRTAYYKSWKYLFRAIFITAIFFLIWDYFFLQWRVWGFNPLYITGIYIFDLPIEEILFFIAIPYATVFIYDCMTYYCRKWPQPKWVDIFFIIFGIGCWATGLIFFNKTYTSWTFILLGTFILLMYINRSKMLRFNPLIFLFAFFISLIPFFIINGYLTAIPVVLYNNQQNLGIRIGTVPFEDIFYSMLIMLMNVVFFEWGSNIKGR